MKGYEFMTQNPFLTVVLLAIIAATFVESIKYLTGYKETDDEQTNQKEKS